MQVKQRGVEDTEMNGIGSSPEGVHGPAGEQKQTKGHWERNDTRRERKRESEKEMTQGERGGGGRWRVKNGFLPGEGSWAALRRRTLNNRWSFQGQEESSRE